MGMPSQHGLDSAYGTNLNFRGHDGATVLYTPARELLYWDAAIGNWFTASGKALYSASLPRILSDDFKAAALDSRWITAKGSDGQAVLGALVSGAAAGELALVAGDAGTGIAADGSAWSGPALSWEAEEGQITLEYKAKLDAITNVFFFLGLTDVLPNATLEEPFSLAALNQYTEAYTANATDAAGFLFDTAALTDTIRCVGVKAGDEATHLDSALAPVAGTHRRYKMVVATDGSARFFIDGVLIGTVANAVSPGVDLVPIAVVCSRSTATRTLTLDYASCR